VTLKPRPFLKWAGGKSRLISALARRIPETFGTFHEPFLGGGALFFHLAAAGRLTRACLSDINQPLVDTYRGVQRAVEEVIDRLREHARRHDRDHYYQVRDVESSPANLAARAARMIYLNRTCYNGLYRENQAGRFNVPMGRYSNPRICDEENLRAVSRVLAPCRIECRPYSEIGARARQGDLVYFDPPYQPASRTASFTSYDRNGFREEDQAELSRIFRDLAGKGVLVLLSNSDTPLIRRLYAGFPRDQVAVARAISCRADGRGPAGELIIRGMARGASPPRGMVSRPVE
jgi:DNA adenine methylase